MDDLIVIILTLIIAVDWRTGANKKKKSRQHRTTSNKTNRRFLEYA